MEQKQSDLSDKIFRALDSYDDNKKIDREEFLVSLRENGVELTC